MKEIIIPQDIKDLLLKLQDKMPEFSVYLGGGYIRDLYVDKTAKDIDIVLIPRLKMSWFKGTVPLPWDGRDYIPEDCLLQYRKDTSDVDTASDMEQRGVQGLVGMLNYKTTPNAVQYIIYKEHLTLEELAEDFDMGICQVAYCPNEGRVYMTPAFIKGHEEKVIECLQTYCVERTYARYVRMEKKFPNYKVIGKPDKPLSTRKTRVSAGSV